jgi:inner membrane protein
MTGRTHDLAAFTVLSVVTITQHLPTMTLGTIIFAVGANLLGGIAPDIDEPTAPLWRNIPPGRIIGRIFDKMIGGHRFISHSLLGLFLFGLIWYFFLQFIRPIIPHINVDIVWWSFMIGVLSHLVTDTFTKEGVPWLLPISYKFGFPPIRAFRITAGGLIENLIIFPGLLVINAYLLYVNYARFLELFHHS